MILYDALKKVDKSKFYAIIMRKYGNKNKTECYMKFLDKLLSLTPQKNSEDIILGVFYYDDDTVELEASLYNIDEIINNYKECPQIIQKLQENVKNAEQKNMKNIKEESENIKKLLNILYDKHAHPYNYMFSEWTEILGAEVSPKNIESIGLESFCFAALYELSWNGFTEEEQNSRKNKLDESIEEIEKIKQLPEEEQSSYFSDIKDVMEELRNKYNIPEPAKEEQEYSIQVSMVNAAKTSISEYTTIQENYQYIMEINNKEFI